MITEQLNNPSEFRNALYEKISEKVSAVLEQTKKTVAEEHFKDQVEE